ncbi:MAG: recombination mediator RecR, partial [Planctomycetota bacterium]
IGRRSAERLAMHILTAPKEDASALAAALRDVKTSVRHCDVCFNLSNGAVCSICEDHRRDRSTVLVVEQPKDLIALETTASFRGLYHVLMGRIDPLEGIGPESITVDALLARIESPGRNAGGERVQEVILGTNPTLEGDGTALYLAEVLNRTGIKVTRLARGVPMGGQIEMTGRAVLADAIVGRTAV